MAAQFKKNVCAVTSYDPTKSSVSLGQIKECLHYIRMVFISMVLCFTLRCFNFYFHSVSILPNQIWNEIVLCLAQKSPWTHLDAAVVKAG